MKPPDDTNNIMLTLFSVRIIVSSSADKLPPDYTL
jgi:hypothetical protein